MTNQPTELLYNVSNKYATGETEGIKTQVIMHQDKNMLFVLVLILCLPVWGLLGGS